MKAMFTSITRRARAIKLTVAFVAATVIAVTSTSSVAFAAPAYFDVDKPSPVRICFRAWWGGNGWRALGFRSLDQCLRYVTTGEPEDRRDCRWGGWYYYGFNNRRHCVDYALTHGGGYDGRSE